MQEPTPYVYTAKIISNYDGDTMKAQLDLGMGIFITAKCRLLGLDTPEIKAAHKTERELAVKAKTRLKELIGDGEVVLHSCTKPDKYGRLLVLVWKNGLCANDVLIAEGLAKAYDGGTKESWNDPESESAVTTA